MGAIVNKTLNWIIKIAGMIICAPVTWLVAGQLFFDVQLPAARFIVQLAAVLLVEGVLLSNWLLLELDRQAAPEIKTRYALTALGMYAGLWVLAWQHGEGPAGLVFRAALGAALLGSGWDTYVKTWLSLTAKADKNASEAGAVKRHRRKLAIADAKDSASVDFELLRERRDLARTVELEQLRMEKDRALKGVALEHKRGLRQLTEQFSDIESGPRSGGHHPKRGGFPYDIRQTNQRRRLEKSERLERLAEYRAAHPNINPSALAEWAVDSFGVAKSTAWDDLKALQAEPPNGNSNGNGVH